MQISMISTYEDRGDRQNDLFIYFYIILYLYYSDEHE